MSLRDQLVSKGLVSKKRARQINRESKAERKQAEGARRRKKQVEREAAAEEARRKAEAKEARLRERKEREEAKAAHEHVYRVRQIVRNNRLGGRGPVPFAYRLGETGRVRIMFLKDALARDLRVGRAAIAGFEVEGGEWEYHVITERGAQKLAEVEPSALAHFVQDTKHLRDPSEVLLFRQWEGGLGPHRVHDAGELKALLERERARDAELSTEEDEA